MMNRVLRSGMACVALPWQMVAPELYLMKKVTFDEVVVERIPEKFYVLPADIEAHGHTGACLGCAALASHGRARKPHNNECRERIRTIIERTLTGFEARMNAYNAYNAGKVKGKKRARVDRGAGNVIVEPGNDEQMADRYAVASSEDERQHDENRMRDRRQLMKNHLTC